MCKVLLTSDTHIGITKDAALRKMYRELDPDDFDIIIHAGDYSGGTKGWRGVRHTVRLIREFFPDKPFLSVIGNHDYWYKTGGYYDNDRMVKARTSVKDFDKNYEKVLAAFKDNNVHFLDLDGPYQLSDVIFVGHSGWYANLNPPTTDRNFLPSAPEGANVNSWMYKKVSDQLQVNLDKLNLISKGSYRTVVFVSHFPVVKVEENDYKGAFEDFCWSESIKELMQREYNCQHFLNGHSHQNNSGPLRYECGSDYYRPRCKVIYVD